MDFIFYNGTVVTMDCTRPLAEAVAIQNGVILRVGATAGILKLATRNTRLIDLDGRLLLPGFNDSHMHLLSYGYGLEKVALEETSGIEDMIHRGRQFSAGHKALRWIQGRGFNNDRWADHTLPTRKDLDRISTATPITFIRDCNRVVAANTRAIEMMGVTRDTPQPPDGRFDTDADGIPSGIFRDGALRLVERALPPVSADDIRRMLIGAGEALLRHGVTAVQTDDFEAVPPREHPYLLPTFQALAADGRLPVRVYEQCRWEDPEQLRGYLAQGCATGAGVGRFHIGPLKLLCDGVLGVRTALLSQPYADRPDTCGHSCFSRERLAELVETAHNAGMSVAIHAIGDRGLDMALDAIERATLARPRPDPRHSVIHCQVTRPEQLTRLREMNVIAHLQPIFIDSDQEILVPRAGPELARSSYAWRTIADLGIPYAFGSDAPICTFDPIQGIYCAVTRKDRKGIPAAGWMPEQRLTVAQAVYGYTLGAAYAARQEAVRGSVTVGKLADLVVLDRNIFCIPTDEIKDASVDMTMLDGAVVYER